jgi:hypothetical protein
MKERDSINVKYWKPHCLAMITNYYNLNAKQSPYRSSSQPSDATGQARDCPPTVAGPIAFSLTQKQLECLFQFLCQRMQKRVSGARPASLCSESCRPSQHCDTARKRTNEEGGQVEDWPNVSPAFESHFTARNIERVTKISIQWTDNLVDHLRLAENDQTLCIFHHASFLKHMEHVQRFVVLSCSKRNDTDQVS